MASSDDSSGGEKVEKSEEAWREQLSSDQFEVCRSKATEPSGAHPAGTGKASWTEEVAAAGCRLLPDPASITGLAATRSDEGPQGYHRPANDATGARSALRLPAPSGLS